MNIEAGKLYVTRNGSKVRIYATDGSQDYPIHGSFLRSKDGWVCDAWRASGSYMSESRIEGEDIVGPWIDKPVIDVASMPAWCDHASMDSTGDWFAYGNEPVPGQRYWNAVGKGPSPVHIPKSHAPKWAGDWKDSLVKFR